MGKIIKDTLHANGIDIGIVSKEGRYGGTYGSMKQVEFLTEIPIP